MMSLTQSRTKECGRAYTFFLRVGRFMFEINLSHDRKPKP